jgi:hypothetical protein
MTKQFKNTLYIFAVAMTNSPSQPRFTLERLNVTEAVVVGENRNLTITRGVFEDEFSGYGVHIYEIHLISSGN